MIGIWVEVNLRFGLGWGKVHVGIWVGVNLRMGLVSGFSRGCDLHYG